MKRLDVVYGPDSPLEIALLEEWLALSGAGFSTIDHYITRLRDKCEAIGGLPYAGQPRDDLFPGLRTVVFEKRVLIAYRIHDDHVEIMKIFPPRPRL